MANYVKFELEDGTVVYIESTESSKGSGSLIPSRGGGAAEAAEQVAHSFEQSVDSVRKMASTLINRFKDGFTEEPSEVAITFSLKASGEVGSFVIARGGVEANYNVSLRWSKDKPADKDKDKGEG